MIDQTIGHYKILEKLGEGGMGVVYKAQDLKLNRTVALKFLPDRVQKEPEAKARFLQEAQAAAGLNHPNICTIHGVEEVDGSLFMVMEYVEGGTLREKIPFKKADDAVTIAAQIGEALQEAHGKGIVHRDVKADNIMMTSKGQAKVMDFGLAKLKGSLKLTRTSSTVGTLGYMAPEQIQGGDVNYRSDIFSFGVLLFEMLTGKLPFRGEHEAAMVYSIVNEEPQDITTLVPDLSPLVANLIQRCLEKDPSERYQHFDDIEADLKRAQKKTSRVTKSSAAVIPPVPADTPIHAAEAKKPSRNRISLYGAIGIGILAIAAVLYFTLPYQTEASREQTPSHAVRTLAVLPLENIGGQEQNEFFSDGMTEDMTAQIAKVNGINVVSRTSAMRYKGSKKSLKEIGSELGASVVLEGSVQRSGERVRIVCQLIDAETDNHLWTEMYDRDLKDIFAIQTEVAQEVAAALKAQLTPAENDALASKPTNILDAYTLYLKGRYHWRKRTVKDLQKGVEYFREAIQLDPGYALAYTGLSDCLSLYKVYNVPDARPDEFFAEAEAMARKAVALNPKLAEAHAALGNVLKEWKWDWYGAERELKKAIELNPKYATANQWYAEVLVAVGRIDEALTYAQKAYDLEPDSPIIVNVLGLVFSIKNENARAERLFKKAIELAPDIGDIHANLADIYIREGRYSESVDEMRLFNPTAFELAKAVQVYHEKGVRPAISDLSPLLSNKRARDRSYAYIEFDYVDESLFWLEQAVQNRDPDTPLLARRVFGRLSKDPRYIKILREIAARE
jgi:serine/threonine protein kinase/tetratricopeptide (TPR) repeat protein